MDELPDPMDTKELTPSFTGRKGELEQLKVLLDDAMGGKGSTALISGEAGIGKTRLIEELLNIAEENNVNMIRGWCLTDTLEPLLPFKEALRGANMYHLVSETPPPKVISAYLINNAGMLISKAELKETELDPDIFASMLKAVGNFIGDSLSMMGEKKSKGLNTIGYDRFNILIQTIEDLSLATVIEGTNSEILIEDMRKTLIEIGDRFDSWDGDMGEADEIQPRIAWFVDSGKFNGDYLVEDPKIRQENFFDNVLLGLQRLSSEQPIVLFLDDLQWADHTSLKLLHYLSRNTRSNRIFLIGTYRPEDIIQSYEGKPHQLRTTIQDMRREDLFMEMELKRLDEVAVNNFVNNLFGDVDIEGRLAQRLYNESDGNPFFLIEVVRMLVEEGHLKKDDHVWNMVGTLEEVHIPSKIYDVVVRRLDRLIDEQKDLLECASVVGEEFESEVVGVVTGMNRIILLKNLSKIEKTHNLIHLIRNKYMFDHRKVYEVLYNGINEELKKEYHKIIADTYDELYKDSPEEVLDKMAHHLYRAGDKRAGSYLLELGGRAKDGYSNEEALELYQRALPLLEGKELMWKAKEGLGDVYFIMGEYEMAIEHYSEVIQGVDENIKKADIHRKMANVYEHLGNLDKCLEECGEGLDLLDDDSIVGARLLGRKGWAYIRQGKYDVSEKLFTERISLAKKIGDKKEIGQAEHDIGSVYIRKSDFDNASLHLEKALEIRKETGDKRTLAATLNNMALVYQNTGDVDKALEHHHHCFELLNEIGDKWGVAASLNNKALVNKYKGGLDDALECHFKSLDIKKKIGDKQGIAGSLNNIGTVYEEKDELDKALEYFQKSYELRRSLGNKWTIAESLNNMGDVFLEKGDFDKAITYYNECIDICEETDAKSHLIFVMCSLAEAMIGTGETQEAIEKVNNAIVIAKDAGEKAEEGRAHRVLGMAYRELDLWDEARQEFEFGKKLLEEAGSKKKLARLHYEYGLMCKELGDTGESKNNIKKALSIFREIKVKLWINRCEDVLRRFD